MIKIAEDFKNREDIFDILILSFLTLFILYALDFQSVFINTIPEGGDYLFHYVKSFDLQQHFPSLRFWTNASLGGMSTFHLYPCLFFILVQILSFVFPLNVSFKFLSFIGAVLLPLVIYFSVKIIRPKDSSGIIAAVFTTLLLFHLDHFAYGGNLKSIVVGEFCYSIAILVLLPLTFFLYKGVKENKYLFLNLFLFFIISLLHPIPTVFSLFLPLYFLFFKDLRKNWKYLLKFYIIAILFFSFWAVPYAYNMKFQGFEANLRNAGDYEYGWPIDNLSSLFPSTILPLVFIFSVIIIIQLFKRRIKLDSEEGFILFGIILSCSFFLYKIAGWPIRFLPFLYLFMVLFLSLYFGRIISSFKDKKSNIKLLYKLRYLIFLLVLVLCVSLIFSWNLLIPLKNMSNYQLKGQPNIPNWENQKEIIDYVNANTTNARFFTNSIKPETFYIYTEKSSVTGMFHFSFAGEFMYHFDEETQESLTNRTFDKLELVNAKYIITDNENFVNSSKNNPFLSVKKYSGKYYLFSLNISEGYVKLLDKKPIIIENLDEWKTTTKNWNSKFEKNNRFIVYSNNPDKEERFVKTNSSSNLREYSSCNIKEKFSSQRIEIKTDCINKPLLVKVAYFPNWKVKGADQIYLVSPGFMLIYPQEENVILYYSLTPIDYFGTFLFFMGILLSFFILNKKIINSFDYFLEKFSFIFKKFEEILKRIQKNFPTLLFIIILLIPVFLIFSVANVYYKFPHDIVDSFTFQKAKINFELEKNQEAIDLFQKIQSNKYSLDKQYYLSLIYFKEDNFEEAKENLMNYISKAGNTEKSAELRYNYILALSKQEDKQTFLHEIYILDSSHQGSPWREKAMNFFEEWKKTNDYNPEDLA